MDYNKLDRKNAIDVIKNKFKKSIILAISLVLVGFIIAIVLAISFVGEDGYIRDDAPGEWLFIAIIPIILGMMMLFVPLISTKKIAESYNRYDNTSEISPEQAMKDFEQIINPLNKVKVILIIITVIFFGVLLILVLLGKLSWSEFIDAIF